MQVFRIQVDTALVAADCVAALRVRAGEPAAAAPAAGLHVSMCVRPLTGRAPIQGGRLRAAVRCCRHAGRHAPSIQALQHPLLRGAEGWVRGN